MTAADRFWAEALWAVIGVGLAVYAVTGGADLGAGLFSLLAGGPRRAEREQAIRAAIAPIWEANHVWLIFVIVVLFAGFSPAFAAIGIALHIPISLVLLGLVFRGAAYVFHAYGIQGDDARAGWSRVFAWSSVLTPLALGAMAAALASGAIRLDGYTVTSGVWAGWTTPFALGAGLFALCLFALLAAVYLAADTEGAISDDFRRYGMVLELVSGALAAATYVLAGRYAPVLHENLRAASWTWPLQVATAAAALATVFLLWTGRPRVARFVAPVQVALVVTGWGLALRGHFILPDMTLERATPHPEVLPALAAALAGGSLLLVPALVYLFWIFKRPRPTGAPNATTPSDL